MGERLTQMVHEARWSALFRGGILASVGAGLAVWCAMNDQPWLAAGAAWACGLVIGVGITSLVWLRTHYRKQWDAHQANTGGPT